MQWNLYMLETRDGLWEVRIGIPDDVFANDMAVCRPPTSAFLTRDLKWIICFGEVVYQGVQPDIDGLRAVIWYWNPPTQPLDGSRYGEILQACLYVLYNIFHTGSRNYEVRVAFVEIQ